MKIHDGRSATTRVLMLADFYPPFVGGVARHVYTLSQELQARGHEVIVATLGRPGLPGFAVEDGTRVYRLQGSLQRLPRLFSDPERRWAPPFPDPELARGLWQVMARERPEVIHAHSWIVHSATPLLPWRDTPLVVTLHEMGLRCAKKNLIYAGVSCSGPGPIKCLGCCARQYGALTGPMAAAALFGSRRLETALADMFLPVSRAIAEGSGLIGSGLPFEIIPNFVADDISSSHAHSTAASQLPSGPYLLYVGALGRHKGLHVLLEAYASLALDMPLVLIGPRWGDTPRSLPSGVLLYEDWPHEDVLRAMQGSLMTLLPSIVPEASPTVVLEAMACGRPVVASHVGGLPEMVNHGDNGLLVPPGDVQALAAAIQTLLQAPEQREGMGNTGRERVRAFQAGSVVPRIEAVYRTVATGRARVA